MGDLFSSGGMLTAWLVFWNIAAFVLYGYDKMQAKRANLQIYMD